jgi:K319-like protein
LGYLSVIGSGRNYQLNTATNKYYFAINSSGAIVFVDQSVYPGKILAPVQLTGPDDRSSLAPAGALFSCQPVENAVRYQLLFGNDPSRVMDFTIMSDATNPPSQLVTSLPAASTWWTVKAYDQFGSTIYADPRLIKRPQNQPPVPQAGLDQVLYAGLAGTAAVTLNGANSSDPEGGSLTYSWAWIAGGTACFTNGVSPMISLPPGVYNVQLMVNEGQVDSQPAQVRVTVLPPLTASLGQTNGTIALSWGALTGAKYQVQYATNLPSGPWLNLGGILTTTGTTASASANIGPDPQRFYRVVVSP